jgi:L-fucose isomerase-like protein
MKNLIPSIGLAALLSPLEIGAERASDAIKELTQLLTAAGCKIADYGTVDSPAKAVDVGRRAHEAHIDAMLFIPVCWFEDYLVLDFIEECQVPLLFWVLPGMETGALCGTQQIGCYLKQLKQPFFTVFDNIKAGDNCQAAMKYLRATALKSAMRRSKIGFSGQRVAGMTHISPHEFMLKKTIGSRVVPFDLPILLKAATEVSDELVATQWQKTKQAAAQCCVPDSEGFASMRIYIALQAIIKEHDLDALTIGCYPHLMGKVCLAASLLADDGIPFACEGDINGAVGQLILALLTGMPTHHTDFLDPTNDGTVIFTHCGSGSFELAEDKNEIKLDAVRLMDTGVCALFPAKTGPVTMISLIPTPNGYQCAVIEAEAEHTAMLFPGNPVKIRFKQSPEQLINWIFDNGIGHHWAIGYGHVADEIKHWASICCQELEIISLS